MEKMLKFEANDLLDSFNRELNQDEMNEIYKALIAYSLNIDTITPEVNAKLDEVIDFYFESDYIMGMVDTDILGKAQEILFDNL